MAQLFVILFVTSMPWCRLPTVTPPPHRSCVELRIRHCQAKKWPHSQVCFNSIRSWCGMDGVD